VVAEAVAEATVEEEEAAAGLASEVLAQYNQLPVFRMRPNPYDQDPRFRFIDRDADRKRRCQCALCE
jgi:hypothetical protein